MNLESIVRKFVRIPWEVADGHEHYKDKEISDNVAYSAFAGPHFRKAPDDARDRTQIFQLMASTLAIAFFNNNDPFMNERNRLGTLTEEEMEYLLIATGVNREKHKSILHIVENDTIMKLVASYVAAAYAFTTWTKPFVATFEKVTAIAYQSMRDGSKEEQSMRRAGLLILTGLGAPSKYNETSYAFLQDMLTVRAMAGRMNMFIDTPQGELLKIYSSGKAFTRAHIMDAYTLMFPISLRMHNHLVGSAVHMPMPDIVFREGR